MHCWSWWCFKWQISLGFSSKFQDTTADSLEFLKKIKYQNHYFIIKYQHVSVIIKYKANILMVMLAMDKKTSKTNHVASAHSTMRLHIVTHFHVTAGNLTITYPTDRLYLCLEFVVRHERTLPLILSIRHPDLWSLFLDEHSENTERTCIL